MNARKTSLSLIALLSLAAFTGCEGMAETADDAANSFGLETADEEAAERPGDHLLALDTSGDGIVQHDEFIAGHLARFDEADADGNGLIQGDEAHALRPQGKHRGPRPGGDDAGGKGPGGKGPDGKRHGGKLSMMFEHGDANGDGMLSQSEVETASAEHFAKMDQDGDGFLTDEDRPADAARGPRKGPGKMKEHLDANGDGKVSLAELTSSAWERIAKADANGDGAVSKEELEQAHEAMRPDGGHRGRGPGDRMHKLDADGDGAISKAEFEQVGESMFDKMDRDQSNALEAEELRKPKGPKGPKGPPGLGQAPERGKQGFAPRG